MHLLFLTLLCAGLCCASADGHLDNLETLMDNGSYLLLPWTSFDHPPFSAHMWLTDLICDFCSCGPEGALHSGYHGGSSSDLWRSLSERVCALEEKW